MPFEEAGFDVTTDDDALIVQKNGDGGDCAARTGEFFTLLKIRERMGISNQNWPPLSWVNARSKLRPAPGVLLRYTKPPYNDIKDVSRDQTIPMMIAAGYVGDQTFIEGMWSAIKARWFRCQNGDLCGPEDLAVIFRVRQSFGILPLVIYILGDIQLIFAVLVRCWFARDPNDVGDDINLTLYCLCAQDNFHTPFSMFAIWLYKKLRPKGIQYAFDWYHRPESGGNPFNELARPIILKRLT